MYISYVIYISYVGLVDYQYSKQKLLKRRNSKKKMFLQRPKRRKKSINTEAIAKICQIVPY